MKKRYIIIICSFSLLIIFLCFFVYKLNSKKEIDICRWNENDNTTIYVKANDVSNVMANKLNLKFIIKNTKSTDAFLDYELNDYKLYYNDMNMVIDGTLILENNNYYYIYNYLNNCYITVMGVHVYFDSYDFILPINYISSINSSNSDNNLTNYFNEYNFSSLYELYKNVSCDDVIIDYENSSFTFKCYSYFSLKTKVEVVVDFNLKQAYIKNDNGYIYL